MKTLFLILIALNLFGRTCDTVSVDKDYLYLEFTDFEVKYSQKIHYNNIQNIYFGKINNKIISVKSDTLICEIIENNVPVFKKWFFE